MGLLGWIILIFWGLIHLPEVTGFLLCVGIAWLFIVLVLGQLGLIRSPGTHRRRVRHIRFSGRSGGR